MRVKNKILNLPDFIITWLGKVHAKKGLVEFSNNGASSDYIEKIRFRTNQYINEIDKHLANEIESTMKEIAVLKAQLKEVSSTTDAVEKNKIRKSREISKMRLMLTKHLSDITTAHEKAELKKKEALLCFRSIEKAYSTGVGIIRNKEKIKNEIEKEKNKINQTQ